ncbi:MAG: isoprenyl transferase [Candidatus Longimicrobiales bacterium M2_2A_002]
MPSEALEQLRHDGRVPRHVAVIMDGNGRWARARGLPRYRGHAAGMDAVREAIEGAIEAGVEVLTLFAFSQENWQRPPREVNALMLLLQRYVQSEAEELREQGVEVKVFGDLDRLASGPRKAVEEIQAHTRGGDVLALNLMISYGGRDEIVRAARSLTEDVAAGRLDPSDVDEAALASRLYTADFPDPDLLVRTSGEQRISNFLLWQLAYTELYTTATLWPDFTREHLYEAILAYQQRERRFGRIEPAEVHGP